MDEFYPLLTINGQQVILSSGSRFSTAEVNRASSKPEINDALAKISITERDGSGAITGSHDFTVNHNFSYNGYGFISRISDPATPTTKTTYVYNK